MRSLLLTICLLFSTSAFSIDEINDANFQQQTENLTGIVYYYADWCPWCTEMSPILEKMEKEFPQLKFTKVNVTLSPVVGDTATGLPYVSFYKNGKLDVNVVGFAPEEDIRKFFKEFNKSLK